MGKRKKDEASVALRRKLVAELALKRLSGREIAEALAKLPEKKRPASYSSSAVGRDLKELRAAHDFPVVEWEVKGQTKVARSEAVTPLAEGGKVWVPSPERALWVREWVSELVGFPEMKHDDRVDGCAMALQRLKGYVEAYCVGVPSGDTSGEDTGGGSG